MLKQTVDQAARELSIARNHAAIMVGADKIVPDNVLSKIKTSLENDGNPDHVAIIGWMAEEKGDVVISVQPEMAAQEIAPVPVEEPTGFNPYEFFPDNSGRHVIKLRANMRLNTPQNDNGHAPQFIMAATSFATNKKRVIAVDANQVTVTPMAKPLALKA